MTIKSCATCGGLYATAPGELFAGTPCRCVCPYIVTSREGTSHCRLAEQDGRDAARYRWLRSCGAAAEELAICTDYGWVTGSDFDETIDAAMKDTDHD